MVTLTPVQTQADIRALAAAADQVWHEYFRSLLSPEQIDYMVEKFQSIPAITQQIREGFQYFLLREDDQVAGYTGIHLEEPRLFLSKLYVLQPYRKKGYSSLMLQKLLEIAKNAGKSAIYLTVNKYNTPSIDIYLHKGFQTIDSVVTDIGKGFVMDDYIMERTIDC